MPEEKANQSAATPAPAPSEQVGLRVSLIPDEEAQRRDPRRGFRLFLTAVIVFVVAVGAVVGGLWFLTSSSTEEVGKLNALTADYEKQSKDLAPTIANAKKTQARLKALATILPEHKTGLKILSFLENNTLPSVGYNTFSATIDGVANLSVSASSFEAYAAQISVFRSKKEIKKVVASSLSPNYDAKNVLTKVNFNLSLTFDSSMFINQSSEK